MNKYYNIWFGCQFVNWFNDHLDHYNKYSLQTKFVHLKTTFKIVAPIYSQFEVEKLHSFEIFLNFKRNVPAKNKNKKL